MRGKTSLAPLGNIRYVFNGLIITYILLIILSAILSLILYFSPLSELWMGPLAIIATIISLFFGGRCAARLAGSKGLFYGFTVGITFILIMLIFSSFLKDITWSSVPIKSLYALIAAIIGGISGIK